MKTIAALCALLASIPLGAQTLTVGSKRFTESYILGEIVSQTARGAHKPGLGNTAILLEALKAGAIDLYPEYTGTIAREILKSEERLDLAAINEKLKPLGLAASIPLGFSNSYAIGMRRKDAERLGIRRLSDLPKHPALRFGLSHEFLGRRDGWPGLQSAYALPQKPRGLDHGVAYEALAAGEIDAMDLYTTDAKIERYAIVALEDDRNFFPAYDAVLLYRADAPSRFRKEFEALRSLEQRIDARTMVRLNARAELDKVAFADVAREYLGARVERRTGFWAALAAPDFGRLLAEHLGLVFGSLALAALVGVPLGLLAAKRSWLAQPVLVLTGLLQTVPSLALLAFLIPVTGTIGVWPALIALFLYALLPITRNTHAGIVGVPRGLIQAATALGLRPAEVLAKVEMPLAMPVIMAGVKTSAVINVGTATIAAFIGAGGFGERISQGLALNDHAVLLAGALPAALLALVVHALFELAERRLSNA
ncbi:MAG TPA: glycine betaine ABC transporter substrate-binding protein [Burkholderiales bacterium]|nr:glycine betaine ABC transporter substrate-binding protein [Burkholderiales bacterium]